MYDQNTYMQVMYKTYKKNILFEISKKLHETVEVNLLEIWKLNILQNLIVILRLDIFFLLGDIFIILKIFQSKLKRNGRLKDV